MRRILTVISALVFSFSACAYEVELANQLGIITPEVATDGFVTRATGRDKQGNLLVCPTFIPGVGVKNSATGRRYCTDAAGKSAWRYPAHLAPKGRSYVGFRVISWDGAAETTYEFYWK